MSVFDDPVVLCHSSKRKRKPTQLGWRGTHMKRLALMSAAAMTLGVAHTALAADLGVAPYAPPVAAAPVGPTWTGLYLGVNGGGGWSHLGVSTTPIGPISAALGNPG